MVKLFDISGDWKTDRAAAAAWAREALADPGAVCLDLETTSIEDAEIVQIGILRMDDCILQDTLVRPPIPIPARATAIHGITDAMVKGAPCLDVLIPRLARLLHGSRVIVYNAAFDYEVLRGCIARRWGVMGRVSAASALMAADIWMQRARWECAMLAYSAWCGDWDDRRGDYRWQRLPGGDHSAIGDCRQTLNLLQKMAQEGGA